MATTTRERLIDTAHRLFYCQGFHAVGLDQIIDEVGVTKTTFYNHFESKDDLVLAVLDWHDHWWRDTFTQKLREFGGDTPRRQLLAIFDAVNEVLADHEAFQGCIFVNVAVVFPRRQDPAHAAAVQHKNKMEDILRQLAGYAGADDPKALAQELSMLMEGAYVTQHITGNPQTADIGRRLAAMIVEKHLPSGE